jgi:hypothetical protein
MLSDIAGAGGAAGAAAGAAAQAANDNAVSPSAIPRDTNEVLIMMLILPESI